MFIGGIFVTVDQTYKNFNNLSSVMFMGENDIDNEPGSGLSKLNSRINAFPGFASL